MTARRELWLAVLLCLLGSGLVLLAVRQPWASYATDDVTIRAVRTSVRGTAVAAAAQALALVGLAGVVAVAATRRTGRVVVGALVALAGLLVVLDVAHLLGDLEGPLRRASGASRLDPLDTSWAWPLLALAGGLLMALAGAVVAARGRRWAALSTSYEVPAARDVAAEPSDSPSDKATWDALDAGHDPTA